MASEEGEEDTQAVVMVVGTTSREAQILAPGHVGIA